MNFNDTLGSSFGALEFLRPYWLFGLLIVLGFSLLRYQRSRYKQTDVIAAHLSEHLVTLPETSKNNRLALNSLAIIACIALSGPSIRSVDIPVYEMQKAQVIALDLSYSMYATDIKPNRLSQAKYKTIDLLKQWTEGEKALIAYAGDAFTISPLTLDSNAIINHIPHLAPELMPARGSRPDLALEKAISLLKNSGYQQGHIVFITDGFDQDSLDNMLTTIKGSKWIVSVLAMGTASGAPISLPDGSLLKDNAGQIVIPRLDADTLYPVSRSSDGLYLTFDAKGQDITLLSQHYENQNLRKENNNAASQQAENKQFIDDGYWLSFLLLPLFLLLFRKGVFYVALLAITLPMTSLVTAPKAEASIWQNNQQNAHQAFEKGDYKAASEAFDDPAWKASALFKNKQYKQAEAVYSDQLKLDPNNADALYNMGNTQAMQENYEQALASYEEALAINPNHPQAKKNKQTVAELLKQKEQQKQEQQKNEQKSPDDQEQGDKDEEQSSDQEKSQDEQSSDQEQSQDEQQQSQESSDQEPSSDERSSEQQSEQDQKDSQESSDEQSEKQLAEQKENEANKNKEYEDEQQMAEQSEADEKAEEDSAQQAAIEQALSEQQANEEYEALPNWLKNMPDDPSLLLRNKMRLEYRKRSSNKPVLQKNNGEIW